MVALDGIGQTDTQACELQNRGDMLILRPNGTLISAHCDYLFDDVESRIIGKLINSTFGQLQYEF